jgi:hypothetical protein
MNRHRTFYLALAASLLVFGPATGQAHDETSPGSLTLGRRKLAFLIPNLFGPTGLTLPNPTHQAHFDSSFQQNFGPLNAAIASQLTSLPIPSPASGLIYSFDKALGVYTRSARSFGPILAERADTIGKDKFAFGFSHQNFTFDSMDSLPLNRVPSVFVHIPNPANPTFAEDIITAENFIDLRISQFTTFLTYGIHDRIDVSVAMPLISANLGVTSNATIRRIGTGTDTSIHGFGGSADGSQGQFANSSSASGIGDMVARIKGNVLRGRSMGLALGVDVRVPTGDPYDFLGTGAPGVKPFVALSFTAGSFSPHVNLGYQWNGQSVLAGNVTTGEKGSLPNQVLYAVGFDYGLTRRFTLAADVLGQHVRDVERIFANDFTAANGSTYPNTRFAIGSFHSQSGAIGFKVNPVGDLIASFNVLVRLSHAGLQDRVTPLVGLSYAF